MILADALNISITLVIITHVLVSLLLILVVLMQRPKEEGLGAAFGGGMTDGMWGARTTDVLQKGTVYLGSLFFILALVLAILVGKSNAQKATRADAEHLGDKKEIVVPAKPAEEEGKNEAEKMIKELQDLGVPSPAEAPATKETPATEVPAAEKNPDTAPVPPAPSEEAPAAEETPAPAVEAPAVIEETEPAVGQ